MDEYKIYSEDEEGEIISDFEEDFIEELSDYPHISQFVQKLRDHIKRQRKKINKLRNKLAEQKHQNLLREKTRIDCGTQTDPLNLDKSLSQDWDISNNDKSHSIVDQVKQVAESALLQTGFVYEETSGMYYDYNTGYYYDTKQGLYYDGNTGTYYYYDEASKTYQFHSQVQIYTNEVSNEHLPVNQKNEEQKSGKVDKVSDEIDELIQDFSNITIQRYRRQALDLAKSYPPCMRIIVKETNLVKLKMGCLFLVTYTGGSLGREGDHSVLIPDVNISKYHARFVYNETKKQYQIIDSGSRNGTFLNGKRLSVAKQESVPYEITHGSIIKIGETKLLCHIHNGNETCGHCEPGLVSFSQQSVSFNENKTSKKKLHKEELRRLKHKFGVEKDNVTSSSQLPSGYQDRAQARRQHVGSSSHHAKTQQSSLDWSISKDNKGFQILTKMGWSEGRSLGKDGDGIKDPIPVKHNHNRGGLGSSETDFSNIEMDVNVEKKQALWRKTQKRFKEIVD